MKNPRVNSERVKEIARARNLKLSELGRRIGKSHIHQDLAASRRYDVETYKRLTSELGCSFDEISLPEPAVVGGTIEPAKNLIDTFYDYVHGDHIVCICSLDGFAEASNKYLLQKIEEAIDSKGVKFLYFIPATSPKGESFDAFKKIYNHFASRRTDVDSYVSGLYVRFTDEFHIGWRSRYVLVLKREGREIGADRLYVYFPFGDGRWIQSPPEYMLEFSAMLDHHVDLLRVEANTDATSLDYIPNSVKVRYQHSFSNLRQNKIYRSIRDNSGVRISVDRLGSSMAEIFARRVGDFRSVGALKYLDVGCEDGENTRVVYDRLGASLNAVGKIQVFGVDTSIQSDVDDVLKFGVFANDGSTTYENYIPDDEFDFISFVHSTYVLPPSFIRKALLELSVRGVCGILTSPLQGNFINQVCRLIDQRIPGAMRHFDQPPVWKVCDDPFRVYGEDIKHALNSFIGEGQYHFELREGAIGLIDLLDGSRLTDFAKNIVTFFCHDIIELTEPETLDIVKEAIDSAGVREDRVSCESWMFVVSKAELLEKRDLSELYP